MPINPELKVGVLVKLKSGGPEMTIRRVTANDDGNSAHVSCQWFAGKKLDDGVFPSESLDILPSTKG